LKLPCVGASALNHSIEPRWHPDLPDQADETFNEKLEMSDKIDVMARVVRRLETTQS
jgi:hypothetical protein